ncbi:hypothetical protein ALI22I_00095 [Saccharothrix sp. ALI-22-I]|uniref:family 43 glycosylhydrolase n=1 Tax=Saccharothrix sp. ALI-22-I TaxID=1933778 RepID=UPI00097C0D9C|nr:family 43 glycosylhydrolase [Saccharothrix sp. ALI-22-I]ONI93105.1 hypothetical protein ALI22I_00095 [Saccharothrix sp. ALI-22-I]
MTVHGSDGTKRTWTVKALVMRSPVLPGLTADPNIGVAVSDSPTGPFKDPLGKPLIARGAYNGMMIDPAVFTDDDGQSYLYWGNGLAYVVPLNQDMVSFDASKVTEITPSGYREGSFVIKRKGTYYFMWSRTTRVTRTTGSPTPPAPRPVGCQNSALGC